VAETEKPLPPVEPYIDACIANLAGRPDAVQIIASRSDFSDVVGAAMTKYHADALVYVPPVVEPATVTGLEPRDAVMNGPDFTLHVLGIGFTEETIILFNHGEEPTTFVSATEVTTIVKPSLVGAPVAVPVSVVDGLGEIQFTFLPEGAGASASHTRGKK
jgi:hypothetical protein